MQQLQKLQQTIGENGEKASIKEHSSKQLNRAYLITFRNSRIIA